MTDHTSLHVIRNEAGELWCDERRSFGPDGDIYDLGHVLPQGGRFAPVQCNWWAFCKGDAVRIAMHPMKGATPICEGCLEGAEIIA